MKAICYNADGKRSSEVELPEELFAAKYSSSLIYEVVRAEQANLHQGTRKTKGRSEVSGGGRKPWKQKGTGNARQGSTRSPQWRSGGVVFGPQPKSFRINLPKKTRRAGIRAIFLSWGERKNSVHILQDFNLKEYNTKKAYNVFKNMGLVPKSTVVFISHREEEVIKKSFSNIRNICLMNAKRINPGRLFYAGNLVIEKEALNYLAEAYKAPVSSFAKIKEKSSS